MSTRSRIGIEDGETGKVRSIYCHFDGYPSGVGKTLLEHYRSTAKVEELIALGDISALAPEIGEKHDFDYREAFSQKYRPEGQLFGTDYAAMGEDPEYKRLSNMVLAYGRDRGENGVSAAESVDAEAFYALAQEGWEEYCYLYRQGVWLVTEVGGGAGPFLVNATDPNGEAESRWQRVEAALSLGDQALELGRAYSVG